ncbi:uncharacterized protein LOC101863844 [Aplysia californica]|uniref:Uncharacterized protein LOC101863844 n=1 Tax=Aplysia californica TaxID=6500 RepID=A0ABM1A946_APLCA|nr:uncharacterized protein LOC101863844 [Aplysia californica]
MIKAFVFQGCLGPDPPSSSTSESSTPPSSSSPSPTGLSATRVALVFLAWTVTSFLCHQLAKSFLTETHLDIFGSRSLQGNLEPFLLALFLTLVQCCVCLLMVRNPVLDSCDSDVRVSVVIVTSHLLATLTTNYSMVYIQAASTFAIKLTEPVVMAVARRLTFHSPLTPQTLASLPLIILGALLFSGVTVNNLPGWAGILLAFTSNVALAFRNVALSRVQRGDDKSSPRISLRSAKTLTGVLLSLALTSFVVNYLETWEVLAVTSSRLLTMALTSALFHVTYSYLSTCVVLKLMDVISHSVCNIFKRLLVVWLLYSCGARSATGLNLLGLFFAGLGLALYLHGKLGYGHVTECVRRPIIISLADWVKSSVMVALILLLVLAGLKTSQCGKTLDLGRVLGQSHISLSAGYVVQKVGFEPAPFAIRKMSAVDGDEEDLKAVVLPGVSVETFKTWRLLEHPTHTDFLSHTLTDNRAVVGEAQRVLLNLLSDIIGSASHVMLMEIATYENKGDPAIATGEVMLLRKLNKTVVYYCETHTCTNGNLNYALKIDSRYAAGDLVVLMQGGGNLVGYQSNDVVRRRVLERFPHRKLVLLSQSIWIHPKNHAHLQECRKIYSNRPNLIMLLRDRQSFALARQHFNGTRLVLAPDMAFGIGLIPRQLPPTLDIVWLRRDDHESTRYELPPFPDDLAIHVGDYVHDWNSNRGHTDMETSFLIASAGLQYLQRGRVVITDRLHGHILSTLLDIPHVLIDNPPYFKLSSFHRSWTQALTNTAMVTTGHQALAEARKMLQRYSSSLPPVAPYMHAPSVDPGASYLWLFLKYNRLYIMLCALLPALGYVIWQRRRQLVVVCRACRIGRTQQQSQDKSTV